MSFLKDIVKGFANGLQDGARTPAPPGRQERGRIDGLCRALGWSVDERDGDTVKLHFNDPLAGVRKVYIDKGDEPLVLFNVFSVVGALCFGPLVDRFGLRWPLSLGFLALVGVLIALGQATDFTMIMALSGALGFFLLGCNYALYGAAAAYYPADMRGRGSGAAITALRVTSLPVPDVVGTAITGKAACASGLPPPATSM